MSRSEPLGDMLTRIRNAQRAKKSDVVSPASRLRENVLDVLKREGYIEGWEKNNVRPGVDELRIQLKYHEGAAVITKMDSAQKAIQVILTYSIGPIFTYSIGPIFAFVGILLLRKPIMYKINEHRMQRIHGELIEYIRKISSDDDSSIYTYYPVYKYWDKGEYREYRSSVGRSGRKGKIGDSVELFLDENGNVFEAGEMQSQFFLGVVFLIIGLATMGLMLYKELL